MDNTDVKRRVVIVRKSYNNLTGERIISVKPKPIRRRKVVVARGNYSMSRRGGHTIGDILTAKALPFRHAMKVLLARKGYNVSGLSFKYILVKFYNEFSGRKPVDEVIFTNNFVFKLRPDDDVTTDIESARNKTSAAEVTELTNSVINTFITAYKKYNTCVEQELEPELLLKDEELTMAKASASVQRALIAESKRDHFVSSGELNKTLWWLAGTVIILWLLLHK